MMSTAAPTQSTTLKVLALRPSIYGLFLKGRCGGCERTSEFYQPTVAGVPIGRHTCPGCSQVFTLLPEDLEKAVQEHLPLPTQETMIERTKEAARLAELWHQCAPLASLVDFEGVNLGEAAERFLSVPITLSLAAADAEAAR